MDKNSPHCFLQQDYFQPVGSSKIKYEKITFYFLYVYIHIYYGSFDCRISMNMIHLLNQVQCLDSQINLWEAIQKFESHL